MRILQLSCSTDGRSSLALLKSPLDSWYDQDSQEPRRIKTYQTRKSLADQRKIRRGQDWRPQKNKGRLARRSPAPSPYRPRMFFYKAWWTLSVTKALQLNVMCSFQLDAITQSSGFIPIQFVNFRPKCILGGMKPRVGFWQFWNFGQYLF